MIVSLCLAAAAVIAIVFLVWELRRLKQPFQSMAELYEREGSKGALEELLKGVDENRDFLKSHTAELKTLLEKLRCCYCGMGLEKYNAFEDIGGMQSYSLCILTGESNGFILTNLVGRNSTRGYALEITDSRPSRELSGEEKTALDSALRSLKA
ncbi:MAG: DUF4446 family protein [Candidatus Krumholzibacteria bacterium]|nr:DUF4446 family protein [Candidatus Krumholzibacteria bacterium]